jgi:hypothetical protein
MVREIFSNFRKKRLLRHWTRKAGASATEDRLAFNGSFGSTAAFGYDLSRYHSVPCGLGRATFHARRGIESSSALHVI